MSASRRVARRTARPQAAWATRDDSGEVSAVKILDELPRALKGITARAAEGGAAVTAGGTTELHSRSGRAALKTPCPVEALSGRRAAQVGQLAALGGPERAEVKGSGEALSAGRAAAPDQFQGETLGRGRSADRVARALAERAKPAALVGPVEARPCERAGSTVSGHGEGRFSAAVEAVV